VRRPALGLGREAALPFLRHPLDQGKRDLGPRGRARRRPRRGQVRERGFTKGTKKQSNRLQSQTPSAEE
jgi:hypothetical protein